MSSAPIRFFRAYLTQPNSVGAVAPSSAALARTMIGEGLSEASMVVELGPGTGSFTRAILEELGDEAHFLAVERNESFVEHLKERFPRARVVHGCAETTPQLLEQAGQKADVVISGLPWASFDPDTQKRLLEAVLASLKPGGRFSTFAYSGVSGLPRARRFRRALQAHFSRVRRSPIVWRNFPPAFVYHCTL